MESYRKVDSYRKVELGTNACMHAWVDLGGKVESYRKVASYRGFFQVGKAGKAGKFDFARGLLSKFLYRLFQKCLGIV